VLEKATARGATPLIGVALATATGSLFGAGSLTATVKESDVLLPLLSVTVSFAVNVLPSCRCVKDWPLSTWRHPESPCVRGDGTIRIMGARAGEGDVKRPRPLAGVALAIATGGWFGAAGLTSIVTRRDVLKPLLSVTVSLAVNIPAAA